MKTPATNNVNKLPQKTGVYLLKDKNDIIIYIGKSTNIKERVKMHLKNKTWSAVPSLPNPLSAETSKIDYIITENEPLALIKESELIKKFKPRYNIMLRDDKQYFYVGFLPQGKKAKNKNFEKTLCLVITHQPNRFRTESETLNTKYPSFAQGFGRAKQILNTRYAGPFTDGGSLKTVLRYLRKVFPYYTKPHGRLPCQYCHIDRCPGPNPDALEYRKNITKIREVLEGKRPRVINSLKKEMKKYSNNLEFEKAEKIKGQIWALENIFSHKFERSRPISAEVDEELYLTSMQGKPKQREVEGGLKIKSLKFKISSLEAYDISNIQGKEPVASMVRFDNGKPNKKMYRKFKIRLPEKPDDFAMMRDVIHRRLAHPEWPYPDLFLIDGGKGQLTAALSALKLYAKYPSFAQGFGRAKQILNTRFAALAKQENELFIPGRKESIKLADMDSQTRNLLMHARDEAHRFAITYHRKLHRKKSIF